MMRRAALAFKYRSTTSCDATALAGLPLYLELAHVLGLRDVLAKELGEARSPDGWAPADVVLTLVLLNLVGGESVDDIRLLHRDEGLCRLMDRITLLGSSRRERRAARRRRRGRSAFPSASAVRRLLDRFHGAEQEPVRTPGRAVLVPEHELLRGLWRANAKLLARLQRHRPLRQATLDVDATLIKTHKAQALPCYKGYKAFQPLNFFVAEWCTVLYSHFRDGNVPCGYRQLKSLQRALELVPAGIVHLFVRMDTQGYEWELLRWMAEGRSKRFGVIHFMVGAVVTAELKRAIAAVPERHWHDLPARPGAPRQQWAEVCYVPNEVARTKHGPHYRFLVTREALVQQPLAGLQLELPFPTQEFAGLGHYKVYAAVTNMSGDGAELIAWHRKRCGKSEEAHSVMKRDLAGGRLPSKRFGANAAWWAIVVLALNLNEMMKRLALGAKWVSRRLKAVRAHLICVAGRVVEHGRQVLIRIGSGHASQQLIAAVRARILALLPEPAG